MCSRASASVGRLMMWIAERRLHQAAHLARLQRPAGAVERRHEPTAGARRQIAAVGLAAGILRELERELVEAGALPDLRQRGLGLLLTAALLRPARPLGRAPNRMCWSTRVSGAL